RLISPSKSWDDSALLKENGSTNYTMDCPIHGLA
ncbi:LOW QUALITY PROTEIN: hypothetical protein PanWU01x14_301890, partial [Parasponia andersonii]